MANKAFRTIEAGMRDAIAYLGGDKTKGVATNVEVPNLDVAKVRERTGLSQDRFAGAFAINASTLRNWEQGRTQPNGAARVLLTVIGRDPEAVLKALRIGAKPAPARAKRSTSDCSTSAGDAVMGSPKERTRQ